MSQGNLNFGLPDAMAVSQPKPVTQVACSLKESFFFLTLSLVVASRFLNSLNQEPVSFLKAPISRLSWWWGSNGYSKKKRMTRYTIMIEKRLRIWTDGACWPNPGKGGWAWIAEDGRQATGCEQRATNQTMELTAVIQAIESCADQPLLVISDSQYVIKGATEWHVGWLRRGWKNAKGAPVANRDLWERLLRALSLTPVAFQWVKGHAGDEMNEKADRMAGEAAGMPAYAEFGKTVFPDKETRTYSRGTRT